jgi:DNA-binding NarL/FixJ family response regulator
VIGRALGFIVQKAVRVLLCDDQAMIRIRVREALAKVPGITVVGEAAGGHAGVRLAIELAPDLVLMDVSMPDLNGVEATRQIRASAPKVRVLAFSSEGRRPTVEAMTAAGACGYLLKNSDPEEWARAIRRVMAEGALDNALAPHMPTAQKGAERPPNHASTTGSTKRSDELAATQIGGCLVEYLPDKKMVLAIMKGRITELDGRSQAEHVVRLLRDNQASLVLVDCRNAVSDLSYAFLYGQPKLYAQLGAPASTRIAVVIPDVPHRLETYQFYMLACKNAGYHAKLVESRQAAEDWLQRKDRA